MACPELLVLRHGETEWNRDGRLQGALDSPLTPLGRRQAEAQGRILQGIGLSGWSAFVSPQGRARATARIALQGHGVAPIVDDRLREIGMGDWAGRLRAELAAETPALFDGTGLGWYDHAPGGEGVAALGVRAAAFLADLTGPAVIVTHGITSRVLRCLATGLPAEAFESVGGGQGVVYHVVDGCIRKLTAPD